MDIMEECGAVLVPNPECSVECICYQIGVPYKMLCKKYSQNSC
jgi:hypothetical protein